MSINQFCLPNGVQFTRLPEEPRFFGFSTVRPVDGHRVFAGCLVIYEPVARGAALALALGNGNNSLITSTKSPLRSESDQSRLQASTEVFCISSIFNITPFALKAIESFDYFFSVSPHLCLQVFGVAFSTTHLCNNGSVSARHSARWVV
jgi:hypothetical protein